MLIIYVSNLYKKHRIDSQSLHLGHLTKLHREQ